MLVTQIALKEDSVVLMGIRTKCAHDMLVCGICGENLTPLHISYNDWLNFKAEMGPISIPFTYK